MAKPFIKWVGGKRQLMPDLLRLLPVPVSQLNAAQGCFFEPFIGGGALFFALHEQGLTRAVLNDANPELVNLYRTVQTQAGALADRLASLEFANDKAAFEAVRGWDRQADWGQRSELDRAARFIYLNRTSFNGLWRVNSKGFFNVPFGKYANPGFPSRQVLEEAAQALSVATLRQGDFQAACADAKAGDLVYFDPPYAPVSLTANFVGYTKGGFDDTMQQRLAQTCSELSQRGVSWMLSNSDTPYTREVFGAIPGAQLHTVYAGRSVNRDKNGRGKVSEIVVVGQAS